MDRDEIVRTLRSHEAELRAAGIVRLGVFGSAARQEESSASDIDLLATFDETKALSFLDVIHLENRLSDLLGRRVDLVEDACLKPRIRPRVEKDLVLAF